MLLLFCEYFYVCNYLRGAISKFCRLIMETEEFLSILSAEDDLDDHFIIKEGLSKAGVKAEIEFVTDGEALIEKLLEYKDGNRPNIILLDLNMPKMNGHEALKIISSLPEIKDIPVVVLTTSEDQSDIDQCYQLGVNKFITKPASFEELVDIFKGLSKDWAKIVQLPSVNN